jgi:hypothetical protein
VEEGEEEWGGIEQQPASGGKERDVNDAELVGGPDDDESDQEMEEGQEGTLPEPEPFDCTVFHVLISPEF